MSPKQRLVHPRAEVGRVLAATRSSSPGYWTITTTLSPLRSRSTLTYARLGCRLQPLGPHTSVEGPTRLTLADVFAV